MNVCVLCFYFVFLRESLIRTAFQCLQLVVTDFLPTMPCTCLQIVVEVAGSFGLHNQELNISLTSIGLLVSFLLTYSDAASGFHFFLFFFKWKLICSQLYKWKPQPSFLGSYWTPMLSFGIIGKLSEHNLPVICMIPGSVKEIELHCNHVHQYLIFNTCFLCPL